MKIWFQNRRAKDRKQKKKLEPSSNAAISLNNQHTAMSKLLETNTKLDTFHLQNFGVGFHTAHNLHVHHN